MNAAGEPRNEGASGGRGRLLRDASVYMAAIYVSQALSFAVGFITKGLLGPEDLGVWALLSATLAFVGLLELGVVQAANKEISYALGKGEVGFAHRLKGVQFTFVAVTSMIGTLGLISYALMTADTNSRSMTIGLLAIAFALPASQIHMGQVSLYWANGRFTATGVLVIFEAALAAVLGLLLVWKFGLAGQVAIFLLTLLVKFAVLSAQARSDLKLRISFSWDVAALLHLLKIGIPLQIINMSNIAKASGTVFVISHFFDTREVGYFALALSVQTFIYWTPNAFSVVMFPRFQTRFAQSNDDVLSLVPYLIKPLYGLAFFLLPILASAAYYFSRPLIEHALPAYTPTVHLIAALLPGTFFMSMEHMPGQLLVTANRLWMRVGIAIVGIALIALCAIFAAWVGADLVGFVFAFSLANTLAFLLLLMFACHLAGGSRQGKQILLRLLGAFVYVVFVILAVDQLVPDVRGSWFGELVAVTVKWLASLLLMTPIFAIADRQVNLVAAIRELVPVSRKGKA